MSNPFLPLGNFRSLKNTSDRLTLAAQRGLIEIAALSGGVVRVHSPWPPAPRMGEATVDSALLSRAP